MAARRRAHHYGPAVTLSVGARFDDDTLPSSWRLRLDLASYDASVAALSAYRGALLVVSHDVGLLEDIGVDRMLELTPL